MNLADFLEYDIIKRGIKRNFLAEQLGIRYETLYHITKKGRKAGNNTLRSIAEYYNISLEKVVELNDNQQV